MGKKKEKAEPKMSKKEVALEPARNILASYLLKPITLTIGTKEAVKHTFDLVLHEIELATQAKIKELTGEGNLDRFKKTDQNGKKYFPEMAYLQFDSAYLIWAIEDLTPLITLEGLQVQHGNTIYTIKERI